jgi:hypothetical protein
VAELNNWSLEKVLCSGELITKFFEGSRYRGTGRGRRGLCKCDAGRDLKPFMSIIPLRQKST